MFPNVLRLFAATLVLLSTVQAGPREHEARMSFLDNGTIRLGVDLGLGGAITWLSRSGTQDNIINSADWGRQVQMSYYAGPIPFVVGKKKPAKQWLHLGWNPIQAGDDFGHGSKVLDHHNDGKTLYIKCLPMQWPLDEVPGECAFECWLELDGPAVRAKCRFSNARTDHTPYPARTQELPAVYTNGTLYRVMTYAGDRPYTGDALTQIKAKGPNEGWSHWLSTERWSALVNEAGWGLGVWNPDCVQFIGGFNGMPGKGDSDDQPCGYVAPIRFEVLDHHIVHEFHYELILGTLEEIRERVAKHRQRNTPPSWKFTQDRQGWFYRGATDAGWPIKGELNVRLESNDPQIHSPYFFCPAEEGPVLVLDAAFKTAGGDAQIFWGDLANNGGLSEQRSIHFPVTNDGEFHEVRVRLADSPEYRGSIVQFRLDPANAAGGSVRLRSVRLEK